MNWKRLRPYILEMVMFLIISAGLIVSIFVTHSIVFQWSKLLLMFVVFILIWLVSYMFGFVLFAESVISDFLLKRYETVNARFVGQAIYRSSSFLVGNDKKLKNGHADTVGTLYFTVVVKTREGIDIFVASEYFCMEPNVKYRFVFGKRSKALIDVQDEYGRSL